MGIGSVVERHYEALNKGDLPLFDSTVDSTNKYWKAVQEQQYSLWFEAYGGSKARPKLLDVKPVMNGYYRARILLRLELESGAEGEVVQTWIFRRVNGRWRLTEPTRRQLGALHRMQGVGITVEYYNWDREQVSRVSRIVERSFARASAALNLRPRQRVQVRLLPAYEVSPGGAAGHTVGYYLAATPNILYLRSPGSYGFGGSDPDGSLDADLDGVATHEFTHLLQDRKTPLKDLPDWMTEGLAEWVADYPREYEVTAALDENRLWDLTLLNDFSTLSRDVSLAYGQSYELVDFLIESKGKDAYWKLAKAYAETERLETAIQRSTGLSRAEFERRWLLWLRDKYGRS